MKMMKLIGKTRGALLAAILAAAAFATLPLAAGTTIGMTATDKSGESSFVSGLHFDGHPPSLANDYVVTNGSMALRTPAFTATEATNIVFGGKSLTIGNSTTKDNVFGICTLYPDEARKATITVNDLRIYGRNIVNMVGAGKGCLAGHITIYDTSKGSSQFRCGNNPNRILEVAATIEGDADKAITFNYMKTGCEFRMTGDMSSFLGTVSVPEHTSSGVTYNDGRFVIACPYAASSTTVADSNYLTLGPNFSYVGTGTLAVPAGTRFTAAYDSGTGTTIPVVMDTEHFTLAESGKFEVSIDAASIPTVNDYIGKTLPIVKIPSALRTVTEADFTDVTEGAPVNTYGLPNRSVQVDTDGDGMQTVSIVVRSYFQVADAAKTGTNPDGDGNWYLYSAGVWSNVWSNVSAPPDKAFDYLIQSNPNGNMRTPGGDYVFPGHSLTLVKNLAARSTSLVVSNFNVRGGGLVQANTNGVCVIYGTMNFAGTATNSPALFVVQSNRRLDLRSRISGDGYMRVRPTGASGSSNGRLNIGGDNSDFTGQIEVATHTSSGTTYTGTILAFDAPENLGGAPAAFNYKALSIGNTCVLAPTRPMTLATANRGIWIDTLGRIAVTNGTFGIMEPIRMTGTIQKEGTGILALGGDISFGADGTDAPSGANNVLNVTAGGILPLTTNGFASLSISFAAGTRLVADAVATDAGVQEYGLFNSYGAFTLPSDGKLRVKIANDPADSRPYSIALCTVTESAAAALSGNIEVDKVNTKSVVLREESIVVNGQTMKRFTADVQQLGLIISIR